MSTTQATRGKYRASQQVRATRQGGLYNTKEKKNKKTKEKKKRNIGSRLRSACMHSRARQTYLRQSSTTVFGDKILPKESVLQRSEGEGWKENPPLHFAPFLPFVLSCGSTVAGWCTHARTCVLSHVSLSPDLTGTLLSPTHNIQRRILTRCEGCYRRDISRRHRWRWAAAATATVASYRPPKNIPRITPLGPWDPGALGARACVRPSC